MKNFKLENYTLLSQEEIFHISTDVENFHHVMPNYFKSLNVVEQNDNVKIVIEKIKFLGIPLKIKTKHIITKPNIHKVEILSGPIKGTVFVESYIQLKTGTMILINVELRFSGFMKLFSFFQVYLAKKMNSTMNDFVKSAEKFNLSNTYTNS